MTGFICHFKNHWIALRRLYGQWYDLNSLSGLPETLAIPCKMGDFYLSAHLGTLKEQGYSIFAVTGNYPPLHPKSELMEFEQQSKFNGKMVHTAKIYKASELKTRDKTYPKNLLNDVNRSNIGQSVGIGAHGGNEELMLQEAMRASLQENNNNNNNNFNSFEDFGMMNDEDAQLQQALAMSVSTMQKNNNNNNNNSNSNNNASNNNNNDNSKNQNNSNSNNKEASIEVEMDDEEMMRQAVFMSMQGNFAEKVPSEPAENDADRIQINLKLMNGKQVQRAFLKTNSLEDVSNYVKSIVVYICMLYYLLFCLVWLNNTCFRF